MSRLEPGSLDILRILLVRNNGMIPEACSPRISLFGTTEVMDRRTFVNEGLRELWRKMIIHMDGTCGRSRTPRRLLPTVSPLFDEPVLTEKLESFSCRKDKPVPKQIPITITTRSR
mmetsp:Transcript_19113/g.43713  ORF Transcript_19113/g.43713 Transcript_19113/m.43713 type:complete len:116 (+) Transcript_19113:216-563(+)